MLDAITYREIAIVPSIEIAVAIANDRGGTVWQQDVDRDGRILGDPFLLDRLHV